MLGTSEQDAGGPVLAAEGVCVRYGREVALDGVSLTVDPAECVALVGESGSGKTTLLRCFNRMVAPHHGRIRFRGQDIDGLDPIRLRRGMGYVPQDGGLLPHWRVGANAALVPRLTGATDATERGERALGWVGLEPDLFARRWPHQLSGGQRQRVAIARALAAEPQVVLLDEPFAALDAITRGELQEMFAALRRRLGVTALLVTHDLGEARRLADRIAVLRAGRLQQVAATEELVRRPADGYVRDLLERAGLVPG